MAEESEELFTDADVSGDDAPAPEPDPTPEAEPDLAGTKATIAEVAADLAELGLVVDPSDDPLEFLKHICTAAKTHKATKGLADEVAPDLGMDTAIPTPETPSVAMSAKAQIAQLYRKLADSEKVQLSLQARAADAELRNLTDQIDGFVKDGYVAPAKATAWKNVLGAKKLSLVSGHDAQAGEVLDRVKMTQELIADGTIARGHFWSAEKKQSASLSIHAEERPDHASFDVQPGKPITADKLKAIQAEKDRLMGRAKRA